VISDINFGNYRLGKIRGRKYQDLNFNGQRDPGEPWLRGWTISLINLQTGETRQTKTNARGKYVFRRLAPGSYLVREISQSGWVPVNPHSSFYRVELKSYGVVKKLNFGNNTVQNLAIWLISGNNWFTPFGEEGGEAMAVTPEPSGSPPILGQQSVGPTAENGSQQSAGNGDGEQFANNPAGPTTGPIINFGITRDRLVLPRSKSAQNRAPTFRWRR
jgi:hypothetical protein